MDFFSQEYYEFFVVFNEGDYYTGHDLLEAIWLTDRSNLFIKGLLQMTVALYHYEYGNVKGAREMMKVAKVYLDPYTPRFWNLNVEEVLHFIDQCLDLMPLDIDRVPFTAAKNLPALPTYFMNLEE
ncbi:DUF309 domain-containing protein [Fictibacillus phosphorivorans]|uniref:DUF309 domain-containing protein n=1 Tax=Fictibacillus phosphorivorans TaxID=1221500 RepID=UPI00203E207C|nr:DUF309 domain-containing protein [Fictibacillus phosphorivorans]MCM3718751.1 DUF309 domain-containing protein [Fictibacillus phosphorivorans]MCM3776374.1 DUF309 domain-containing protein [Fictibacillus phosphorivorans]